MNTIFFRRLLSAFRLKAKAAWLYYFEPLEAFFLKGQSIPVVYFNSRPNVGDDLNSYLIPIVAGRRVHRVSGKTVKHVLGIGSILHFGTKNSYLWGTGVIDPMMLPDDNMLRSFKVLALRGEKTRALLFDRGLTVDEVALGDPAVLMPEYYQPSIMAKRFRVGVIPHYVDADIEAVKKLKDRSDVKVIDVASDPESFVDQIAECQFVISSSLHGLILADSYDIPNVWVRFSDQVIGGEFKFLDYYSTTSNDFPVPTFISFDDVEDSRLDELEKSAKVNRFLCDKEKLVKVFPVL